MLKVQVIQVLSKFGQTIFPGGDEFPAIIRHHLQGRAACGHGLFEGLRGERGGLTGSPNRSKILAEIGNPL